MFTCVRHSASVAFLLVLSVGWTSAAHSAENKTLGKKSTETITHSVVRDMRIMLGGKASAVERKAAAIFADRVRNRSGVKIEIREGDAKQGSLGRTLVVGTIESNEAIRDLSRREPRAAAIGTDGFYLSTSPDAQGRMYLVGQSPSGVIAGLGKLLRLCRYEKNFIAMPGTTLAETPQMPVRGMYFAAHNANYYCEAPLDEVDRYIEDLALWGCNSLAVWFDLYLFNGFDDPAARTTLARFRHFETTAHSLGMEFGMGIVANLGFGTSDASKQYTSEFTLEQSYICPSKPGGMQRMCRLYAGVLDGFTRVDFLWAWPWDSGGCFCPDCRPWGGNGFLRASEQMARLYKSRFPKGTLWLSTWLFDKCGASGEYDALFRVMREQKPTWFDGVLMGAHQKGEYQRILQRPYPDKYPLTTFPEISMEGMGPWGGFGAIPRPDFHGQSFEELSTSGIRGGWPYSEGIFEDIDKFLWIQYYWNPKRSVDAILRDYATFYLGTEQAEDGVRLFHLLEKTHPRTMWDMKSLDAADEAWNLTRTMDERMPSWARGSWRWRIVWLRAKTDYVVKHQGHLSLEARNALAPLFDELERIYHVTNATLKFSRPPLLPGRVARKNLRMGEWQPSEESRHNLALNRPVKVSSTYPGAIYLGAEGALVDGVFDDNDKPQEPWWRNDETGFWASDPARDKTPWILIDLGQSKSLTKARLQFRSVAGKYFAVPSSLTFSISDDGRTFRKLSTTRNLPKEGSAYSPEFWPYPIGQAGRYLRIDCGKPQPSTLAQGAIEFTEIQVLGP